MFIYYYRPNSGTLLSDYEWWFAAKAALLSPETQGVTG